MSMRLFELCFSQAELQKIFSFETKLSDRLTSRENGRLEFKESFNLANIDAYAAALERDWLEDHSQG